MSARDFHNTVSYQAITGVAVGATAVATGVYVDRSGFGAIEFVLTRGATTASTTHTITILTATATSGGATVTSANFLIGDDGATASGIAVGTAKIGYIGPERYVTVKYNSSVATGEFTVTAVKGSPIKQPQS